MTDTIFTGSGPASPTDDSGGVTNRSVGMRLQCSASGHQITSCRYWVPAAGIGTGTLLQVWDGASLLVEVDLNTALPSPTLGAFNTVAIGAAIPLTASHDYVVAVFLLGASHYVFKGGQSFPLSSGGTVSSDTALFRENAGAAVPPNDNGFVNGVYYVDVNVDPASTEFPVSVGGSIAPAGSVRRSLSRSLAGSSTPTGALHRSTSKTFGSSISPAGALLRTLSRTLGGSITPTGAVTKGTSKTFAGTATPAGSITRSIGKALSGAVTPSGGLLKLISKLLGGTVTPTGVMTSPSIVEVSTGFRHVSTRPPGVATSTRSTLKKTGGG